MAIRIQSYYRTNEIDEELLKDATRSCRDQENRILKLFTTCGTMTMWDVYDVYNEIVGPIIPSSVGRSLVNLKQSGAIVSVGQVNGDMGRPVALYSIVDNPPDSISRRLNNQIPKSVKIDLHFNEDGSMNIEKMVEELDDKLNIISERFNIN